MRKEKGRKDRREGGETMLEDIKTSTTTIGYKLCLLVQNYQIDVMLIHFFGEIELL